MWLDIAARAKVNLRLRIFPRGADGYHQLETIYCRIDLCDRLRLRLVSQPAVSIRVDGPESAPEGPANLAVKAAERFLERSRQGSGQGVEIRLEKRVPVGAGLGGGSSDAAGVLMGLVDLARGSTTRREVLEIGSGLGADIPFFLTDKPMALAWGRGNRLLPGPALPPRPLLLAVPRIRIATAEAYARWDERHGGVGPAAGEPLQLSWSALSNWSELAGLAENDFESIVFDWHPAIGELKGRLGEAGADFTLLSGSGSALFAVFDSEERRDEAMGGMSETVEGVRFLSARGPV